MNKKNYKGKKSTNQPLNAISCVNFSFNQQYFPIYSEGKKKKKNNNALDFPLDNNPFLASVDSHLVKNGIFNSRKLINLGFGA